MLAFVHIEKAAGTTVSVILARSFGLRHADVMAWRSKFSIFSAADLRWLRRVNPGLKSIAGHAVMPHSDLEQACGGIHYWTFLREPLSRCASHYQFRVQFMNVAQPFKEWIQNEEFRNFQTKKLVGREDVDAAIRTLQEKFLLVGLLERFDESLIMLKGKLGDPRFDIRYVKAREAADKSIYRQLLDDPESRELLTKSNQADLKLYRFVQEELYPTQQGEYGESLEADLEAFKEANHPPKRSLRFTLNRWKLRWVYRPMICGYRLLHHRSLSAARWP